MFRTRRYNSVHRDQNSTGKYVFNNGFDEKPKLSPFRRFDCFDPETESTKLSTEDLFLNEISQKISLLSLQVSRVENRISAYETQPNDDIKKTFMFRNPPNRPLMEPIRKKKNEKNVKKSRKSKTRTIITNNKVIKS